MKLDFDAGLPLETESSFAKVQQIAREKAILTPILDAVILTLNEKIQVRESKHYSL